jgi:hypothetical protein
LSGRCGHADALLNEKFNKNHKPKSHVAIKLKMSFMLPPTMSHAELIPINDVVKINTDTRKKFISFISSSLVKKKSIFFNKKTFLIYIVGLVLKRFL